MPEKGFLALEPLMKPDWIHPERDLRAALAFLVAAAGFGLLLRAFPLFELPFTYKYLVHAHSHVMLLGWMYLALQTAVTALMLKGAASPRPYRFLRAGVLWTVAGMLCTFPFTGYAPVSILFSTLFLFVSYGYLAFFLKQASPDTRHLPSFHFVRAGLWYMAASSLGPWALGAIMATLGPTSLWYRMAVYFYLHFQYNGWIFMALAGVVIRLWEQNGSMMPSGTFRRIFGLLNAGIILTFVLSTLWAEPPGWFHVIGGIGAILQGLGIWQLFRWFQGTPRPAGFGAIHRSLAAWGGFLLGIKVLLQAISAFPLASRLAVTYPDFIMGYLHGTFLGVINLFLFMLADWQGWIKIGHAPGALYLIGFFLTEGLLFYRGFSGWLGLTRFSGHPEALWAGSLLLFIALGWLLVRNIGKNGA